MGKRIDIETRTLASELSKFNCDENDCENCVFSGTSQDGIYCDDFYLANKLIKDGYKKLTDEEKAIIEASKKNDLRNVIKDNIESAVQTAVADIIQLIKSKGDYPEIIEEIKHAFGV